MFNVDAYEKLLDCFFSQKLSFVEVVFGQGTSLLVQLTNDSSDCFALLAIRSVLEKKPEMSFHWMVSFKMCDGVHGRIHFDPSGRNTNVYLHDDEGKELRTSVMLMEKNKTNEVFVKVFDRELGNYVTKQLGSMFDINIRQSL